MDLRLFTVEEVLRRIGFPAAQLQQGHHDDHKPYDEYIVKDISIEIHAEVGKPPPLYTRKIPDIIRDAKQQ
jgi:hypothetical protein